MRSSSPTYGGILFRADAGLVDCWHAPVRTSRMAPRSQRSARVGANRGAQTEDEAWKTEARVGLGGGNLFFWISGPICASRLPNRR